MTRPGGAVAEERGRRAALAEQGKSPWANTGAVIDAAEAAGKVGDFAAMVALCAADGTSTGFYAVSEGDSVFLFGEDDVTAALAEAGKAGEERGRVAGAQETAAAIVAFIERGPDHPAPNHPWGSAVAGALFTAVAAAEERGWRKAVDEMRWLLSDGTARQLPNDIGETIDALTTKASERGRVEERATPNAVAARRLLDAEAVRRTALDAWNALRTERDRERAAPLVARFGKTGLPVIETCGACGFYRKGTPRVDSCGHPGLDQSEEFLAVTAALTPPDGCPLRQENRR